MRRTVLTAEELAAVLETLYVIRLRDLPPSYGRRGYLDALRDVAASFGIPAPVNELVIIPDEQRRPKRRVE